MRGTANELRTEKLCEWREILNILSFRGVDFSIFVQYFRFIQVFILIILRNTYSGCAIKLSNISFTSSMINSIFPNGHKNPPVYGWISRLSTFLEVFLHFMISSINGDTEDLLTRRTNKTFLLLLVDFARIGPPLMEYNFNPIIRYTNVWMRFGRVFFWSPSFSHHLLRFARCNPIKVCQPSK